MLKPYEEYKPTEYDWLSKVPSHWCPYPMRAITSLSDERNGTRENSELLSVYREYGVIKKKSRDDNHNVESADLSNYKYVHTNNLVMNKMKMWQGSLGISPYDGIVSPAYIVCKIRLEMNYKYLHYLLRSPLFKTFYNRISYGIRVGQWDMRYDDFKSLYIYLPPREEQDQIVRFLDWKLGKINKLIRAKKKQIALLDEQRKATIDKAIMYGINPQASRKESGIIWLGKIPSQWSVMKLKRVCRINASISSQLKKYSLEDFLVFLPMENISSDGKIDCSEKRKLKDIKNGFSSFAKNDVVLAKITPCFENGKGACLDNLETDIGFGTTELIVLRANEKILPRYLYMITQLRQFRIQGAEVMTGSAGQKRVPSDFISNFALGIPSKAEQYEILNYLDNCLAKIDKMYIALNDEIKLLIEYRTRLISDVVTGKVDVRGIEIPEYEAVPDDVTEDEFDGENAMDDEAEEAEVE